MSERPRTHICEAAHCRENQILKCTRVALHGLSLILSSCDKVNVKNVVLAFNQSIDLTMALHEKEVSRIHERLYKS